MAENISRLKLSVCIPVYNGAKSIEQLVAETKQELAQDYELEIVLVNDFSPDNSDEVCKSLAQSEACVKYISLRKNYGEHGAVMCALNYATGDYAAIIDDDFQNPPSQIRLLVEEATKGFDVVYSKFNVKNHANYRNLGSRFNDLTATWLLDKPKDLYLSSFKVLNREIIDMLIQYQGPSPYIDGLILRATRSITVVEVEHHSRREGESNYTLSKLAALWLNMFINFSIKPLRSFALFGLFVMSMSFIAATIFIVQKILDPSLQIGWTSIMVSILFFSGVQIVSLGLIGEYVGKNYLHTNGTPQWTVKEEFID